MADTQVQMLPGTVVDNDGVLAVDVRGSLLAAIWTGGYVPAAGDAVRVQIVDNLATVLGPVHSAPPPIVGTVEVAVGGFATVLTSAGSVKARYMGSAPAALTLVRLDWSTSTPWILGTVVDVPETDDALPVRRPTPPRTGSGSGVLNVAALWSGSYRPAPFSKWESGDVKQGAYGGGVEYEGVWGGYSQAALKSLQGKTITRVQLRIGARLRIGNYNSALTLRIYRSSGTGKGNPNTADGPYTESVPAHAGGRWITLSNAFGNALKDGGTVSIQGGSYGGVKGRSSDAGSGSLRISWRT